MTEKGKAMTGPAPVRRRPGSRPRGLLALATTAALAAGAAAAGDARAAEGAAELSMEEIVDIVSAMDLGTVYEVERERRSYEVKIQAPDGRLKLHVDSTTGEVLREERDDDDERESDEDDD